MKNHPLLMVHPFESSGREDSFGNGINLYGFEILKEEYLQVERDYPFQIIIGGSIQYGTDRGSRSVSYGLFVGKNCRDFHERDSLESCVNLHSIGAFPFGAPQSAKGKFFFESKHGYVYGDGVEINSYGRGDQMDFWKEIMRRAEISVGGAVFGLCHRVACVGNESKIHEYTEEEYPLFRGFGLLDLFSGEPYEFGVNKEELEQWQRFKLTLLSNLVYVDLRPVYKKNQPLSDRRAALIGHGFKGEPKQGRWFSEPEFEDYLYELPYPESRHECKLSEIISRVSEEELLRILEWYLPPKIRINPEVKMIVSRKGKEVARYGKGKRIFELNVE